MKQNKKNSIGQNNLEKSCGAVIFKVIDGEFHYLIEKMVKGHYSICKGHVEGKESEEETALREIREETSINVLLDTRFREVIRYSPKKGVLKDVVFFVAKYLNGEETNQIEEVSEIMWLKYDEAINKLTFPSDKEILEKANNYINSTYKD